MYVAFCGAFTTPTAAPLETQLKNQSTETEHQSVLYAHSIMSILLFEQACWRRFHRNKKWNTCLKTTQTPSCSNATCACLLNSDNPRWFCLLIVTLFLTMFKDYIWANFFSYLFCFKRRSKPSLLPASTCFSIKREVRLDVSEFLL